MTEIRYTLTIDGATRYFSEFAYNDEELVEVFDMLRNISWHYELEILNTP